MKSNAVIVGGGISGLSCASELSRVGLESVVIERAEALGGNTAALCCKATDRCQQCGACLSEDTIQSVKASNHVFTMTNTVISEALKMPNGWRLGLSQQGTTDKTYVETPAVVVASGFNTFDPRMKPQFGYGLVPGVITSLELEYQLRSDYWDQAVRNVAFIQCVGSRDHKVGANYCSRVCCAYALRLGRLLRYRFPDVETSVFYMDIQSFDREFDSRLKAAQKEMRLVRAIPSQIRQSANGRPELVYHGPEDERVFETYDTVVLSVGMAPDVASGPLAELLGLAFNADGFLGTGGVGADGDSPGVFVTGAAKGPCSIEEAVFDGIRTAGQVASYVERTRTGEDR